MAFHSMASDGGASMNHSPRPGVLVDKLVTFGIEETMNTKPVEEHAGTSSKVVTPAGGIVDQSQGP